MSLGIIVTLFACMVQRLASSMRDTKNASVASCRHIMVLPWKCKLVLPTDWAISWTSREKGSFPNKELSALLKPPDLPEGNCARPVLPGLFYLSCFEELLLGSFASHSRVELPLSGLLLQMRWPGLCSHLGQLSGWQ